MGDKLNGWLAAIVLASLAGINIYEYAKDVGRREAIQAMKCQTNSGYSIVDTRTGRCVVIRGKYRG